MIVLKLISLVVAIFSSLMFISNMVADLSTPPYAFSKPEDKELIPLNHAKVRMYLSVLIAVSLSIVIIF